jgi:hypothetical protein
MLQFLAPRLRLSISPSAALLGREIDREFPEVRRVVDELYAELARSNAAADRAFDADVVWPPGTFWERRESARVLAALPYHDDDERDLYADFPRDHPYRTIGDVPVTFATDLAFSRSALSRARLYGAWTNHLAELVRGEADLVDFLVDRVHAHGGEAHLAGRATHLVARYGRATGVHVDGDDEPTGVQFVVTDMASAELLDVSSDYRPSRRALDARPRTVRAGERFVTSLLVRDEGLPEALGSECFLLSAPGSRAPIVHLQRAALPNPVPGMTLLVAETLLGSSRRLERDDLRQVRAEVVAAVEASLPYIERHYVLIDSPHDGMPLWDYRSGKRALVARPLVRPGGGTIEAEAMTPLLHVEGPPPSALPSIAGEPLRFPLGGTFGVGRSILPGLGQEGELLAAWSVARVITRTDRRKERMRREMWSKVELG